LHGGQRAIARQQAADGLEFVQIRPNFYVIAGAGGNVVVQTGPEGVILVDSGSTAMADKVLATIRSITPLPIRYILNTSMDPITSAGTTGWPGRGSASFPARSLPARD
jgi:hypothetical protein